MATLNEGDIDAYELLLFRASFRTNASVYKQFEVYSFIFKQALMNDYRTKELQYYDTLGGKVSGRRAREPCTPKPRSRNTDWVGLCYVSKLLYVNGFVPAVTQNNSSYTRNS